MIQTINNYVGAIAIVGMTGRFPGAANTAKLWDNLIRGVESISRFETNLECDLRRHCAASADQKLVAARSVLEDVDLFDADFFGIYPKEAERMDPQHRLFLECAWEVLEQAGCDAERFKGAISVFAGLSMNTYLLYNLCHDRSFVSRFAAGYQVANYDLMMGNDKDYLPSRVAYKLGLRGAAVAVNSACSTSLVAVNLACMNLLTYQCDMALAGGVSITFPQRRNYQYTKEGMVSADGMVKTFDSSASGTVFGAGVGVVALKRLEDALADGDPIRALILGSAINNDGNDKVGYVAPSVNQQAEVVRMAQEAANVEAETISFVEAHGTATPLGDPIEMAALTQAFRSSTKKIGFCGVGSVKTHLGHLDCAAGVTGLIKTVLSLENEKIPPLLNFQNPNPNIDFASSPFYPVTELMDWKRGIKPRRAGVNALGVGGTNAHVVLEEAPKAALAKSSKSKHLLVLSARTETALQAIRSNLANYLERNLSGELADVAWTLQRGRKRFNHRFSLTAGSAAEAIVKLKQGDSHGVLIRQSPRQSAQVAFLFPGQGSQYAGMGRSLYHGESTFKEVVDECAEILRPHLRQDIRDSLYSPEGQNGHSGASVDQTSVAQLCLFVTEYAIAKLWISWGIQPSVLVGHSIGEFVAAVLAGVFRLQDALELVSARAALMQSLPNGKMLGIARSMEDVLPMLPENLALAAVNSPSATVVSGKSESIESFAAKLKSLNVPCKLLATSHAFHSSMMDPILDEFTSLAATKARCNPSISWISTLTGQPITAADISDPAYWSRQIRNTVRFSDAIQRLAAEDLILLEVGPGSTLSVLSRQHSKLRTECIVISSLSCMADPEKDQSAMYDALGGIWAAGYDVPWDQFYAGEKRCKVILPTYPFERKRYWIAPPEDLDVKQNLTNDNNGLLDRNSSDIRREPAADESSTPDRLPACGQKRIGVRVRELLRSLSGSDISEVGDDISFAELGFDSLFLTQAVAEIQRTFGVKTTFRQLMGDLATLGALSSYLEANVPPATSEVISAERTIDNSGVMRVQLKRFSAPSAAQVEDVGLQQRFGPYRPPMIDRGGKLTDQQRKALGPFVERYVSKTRKSKDYTEKHRQQFADPRAVAGFRSEWKEMIYPIVAEKSSGAKLWDVDGNEYVDLTLGFGVNFLGHSPEFVTRAIEAQLRTGFEIGPQSKLAGEVAELLCEFTGMDRISFCNTGSEAVMAALRLARTVTGRDTIVYFSGGYHGTFDQVLVRGNWVNGEYNSVPIAPGIPRSIASNIIVLDYGTTESIEIIRAHAKSLAAVLVEPVQSRRPGLQPVEFLKALRDITTESGTALIFDEVVTGFRCHPGGIQSRFGIRADLATYGKVVGGGLPIGVIAGKAAFMDALDGGKWQFGDDSVPEIGVTFFAGTFVRHPLAMAAAQAVLQYLKREGDKLQLGLDERTARLVRTMNTHFEQVKAPIRLSSFSSIFMIDYPHELNLASLLWFHLRERGIHVWEGRPCFLSIAHSDHDFDCISRALADSVEELQIDGFLPGPAQHTHISIPAYPTLETSPLTEAEKEIFYSAIMGDDANCAYNEESTIRFAGELDGAALRFGLQRLLDRHSALRSTFSIDGELQMFAKELELFLPEEDVSHLEPDRQKETVCRTMALETSTPFDLFKGPLIRFRLLKLSAKDHILFLTAHHLVCDGWSWGMLIDELSRIYNAQRTGKVCVLPQPMPFADYARWLRNDDNQRAVMQAERFWTSKFADGAPVLELPTDRRRPTVKTFEASTAKRTLDADLYQRLLEASPTLGGTLFNTLFANFAVLLHRLTQQNDLVIGVPAAGQRLAGCDELIGHCLHFLPIRLRIDAQASFKECLKAVKENVVEAYDHQSLTYGSLLRKLNVPRDVSRLPLISVTFNVDKMGLENVNFDSLEFFFESNPKQFTNFDLYLNLVQSPKELVIDCEYNSNLFNQTLVDNWLGCFEKLIEAIVADPNQAVAKLPILSDAERNKLLFEWNPEYSEDGLATCIHEQFQKQVLRDPDAIAVVLENEKLTYGELNQRSNQLARVLRQKGIGPETLVGIYMERSLEMVLGIVGTLKAGGAYLPLDPQYPRERLAFMLEDARPKVVLTQQRLLESLPEFAGTTLPLDAANDEIVKQSVANLDCCVGPQNLAYVIYTSGSTGRPKGTMVSHRNVARLFQSTQTWFQFGAQDVWTLFHSMAFDFSVWEMWGALIYGGRLVVVPYWVSRDPQAFYELLSKERVTVLNQTPSGFQQLIQVEQIASKDLPLFLRYVIFGGEALEMQNLKPWFERHGDLSPQLINMYGITETTVHVTYRPLSRADLNSGSVIGIPIPDLKVYVLDPNGQPVPIGVPGELYVAGAGVARGYLNRPELTADRFLDNPFTIDRQDRLYRTGDLVRFLSNRELEYMGRIDHQVKIRGFRIELGEIEATLNTHPSIAESVVTVRSNESRHQNLVAFVVLKTNDEFIKETMPGRVSREVCNNLREFLSAKLPDYMLPAFFVRLSALPRTPNGKLDRKALPSSLGVDTLSDREPSDMPNTETETKLVAIWREVLGHYHIGVHDNFFDLGGDSILSFQIAAKANALALQLTARHFFQYRTVAAIAAAIDREDKNGSANTGAAIKRVSRVDYRRKM